MPAIAQAVVANVYPSWVVDLLKIFAGFSFATISGLLLYIWRERTIERAINAVSEKLQIEIDSVAARTAALERSVDGYQGQGGLQASVRTLKRAVRWSNTAMKAIAMKLDIDTEEVPDIEDAD